MDLHNGQVKHRLVPLLAKELLLNQKKEKWRLQRTLYFYTPAYLMTESHPAVLEKKLEKTHSAKHLSD